MSTTAVAQPAFIPKAKASQLKQTLQMISDPLPYLEAQQQELGDVFALSYMGLPSLVVLSDPNLIKALLAADPKLFKSGASNRQFMTILLGEHSLIMLDGAEHQRQRRLVTPPLHGDRMRAYGQLMCEVTQQVMASLPADQVFVGREAMQEISLRVILQAVFGLTEGARYEQL